MPRPNLTAARRDELVPIVARAFAELGYRRTSTAELARRCGVRVNVLYRLWPDKKAMFLAAIDYVYVLSARVWDDLASGAETPERSRRRTTAEKLLAYESRHQGEFGLYRIIFAGLSETDDPETRRTLQETYSRFQRFIHRQIVEHRRARGKRSAADAETCAWGIVGLGTVANIARELGLLGEAQRRRLMADVGRLLLEGAAS
jgi:AcrR family transcriptional regulator